MLLEKIKKIYKSDKFPIYVYVLILAIVHITVKLERDDIWFSTCCQNTTFIDYMINRYQTWSSRVVIETCFVVFCEFLPLYIWKILNIAMFYLLAYSISELFIEKDKRKYNTIMCILLLCIPLSILKDAGWVATMNCYLWTAATGLYAIIPLKKIAQNQKITVLQAITYFLAIIYATNQEQAAGILFIIYTLGIIYLLKLKKIKIRKTQVVIFINYLMILLWLILILTCPGNANRKIQEEAQWFPGFSNLSIFYKVTICITSMMNYMIEDVRILFFILIVVLAYRIYKNKDEYNFIQKIIGYSPLLLIALYKYVYMIFDVTGVQEALQSKIFTLFRVAMYILILISIGLSLIVIFKKQKCIIPILIYFCGIVSRLVMAVSPTIFASGERTSTFMYLSFVVLEILLLKDMEVKKWENSKKQILQ